MPGHWSFLACKSVGLRGRWRSCIAYAVLWFAVLWGCQRSDSGTPGALPAAAPTIDPATAAKVRVGVRFPGVVPTPKALAMRAAPQCAKLHEGPVYDQSLVVDESGRLMNAVVWVEEGPLPGRFPHPTEPVVIDQKGCLYVPRVVVAMVGQPVEFRNSDPEPHNVHTKPQGGRGTNFMLSRAGTARTVTFDRPEVAIPVGCDVHPWMVAYVAVLQHPYGAVTRRGEDVELGPLPPGRYTIAVWHEKLGTKRQTVELGPSSAAFVEFVFSDS